MKTIKTIKKATAILLTFVLLLSAATATAFATTGPLPSGEMSVSGSVYFYYADIYSPLVVYRDGTVDNTAVPGASYDLASNTLTINNMKQPDAELTLGFMGDDFKLNVKGTCELGSIGLYDYGYGSSMLITGDGTLTVNGGEGRMNNGIFASGTNINHISVDKTVTLHVSSNTYAMYAEEVNSDAADTVFMADGAPIPGVKKDAQTYVQRVTKEVLFVEDNDDYKYMVEYQLHRDDDPDGIYAASIDSFDGEEFYYIYRYLYIDSYDAYITDRSFGDFGVVVLEKDKLEESGYSFVNHLAKTDIDFFDVDNMPLVGTPGFLLNCASDADKTYVAVPLYEYDDDIDDAIHTDHEQQTITGYEVHRIVHSEDGFYDDDLTFDPRRYDTEEDLQADGYSFVDVTNEKDRIIKVWHSGEINSEDNWQNEIKLIKNKNNDDSYVIAATYTSETDGGAEEKGVYLYKVHHDDVHNADYINGDADPDGEDVIRISNEAFAESDFYYVTYTEKEHVVRHFLSDEILKDSPLREYGYLASLEGDNNNRYAIQGLWYEDTITDYNDDPDLNYVYKLQRDEKRGIDIGTMVAVFTKEDFKTSGYTYIETDQPAAFVYDRKAYIDELSLMEDQNGKQYLMSEITEPGEGVYNFNESKVFTIGDNTYYELGDDDKADVDPNTLTYVLDPDKEALYNCYTEGNEYHHIGTGGGQTEVLIGDVNGDGVVNGADSGLLARYTAGWKGYESKIKNMAAADINRDGNINGADAGLLSRYTASWKGYDKYIKTVTV